eukprot:COSAG01_NODE_773_length_13704_cov_9.386843_16_plen_199_part_00
MPQRKQPKRKSPVPAVTILYTVYRVESWSSRGCIHARRFTPFHTHMTVFYSFLPTTVHTGAPAHDGLGRAALVRRFKTVLNRRTRAYNCVLWDPFTLHVWAKTSRCWVPYTMHTDWIGVCDSQGTFAWEPCALRRAIHLSTKPAIPPRDAATASERPNLLKSRPQSTAWHHSSDSETVSKKRAHPRRTKAEGRSKAIS